MKKILLLSLLLFAMTHAQEYVPKVMSITFHISNYKYGYDVSNADEWNASMTGVHMEENWDDLLLGDNDVGPFMIELKDENGTVLRKKRFSPPRPWEEPYDWVSFEQRLTYYVEGRYVALTYISETPDTERYKDTGEYVWIEHSNTTLLVVDLQGRLCNNDGNCNINSENYLSCPEDCMIYENDGYCSKMSGDGICDPDCAYRWDTDCPVDDTANVTIKSWTGDELLPNYSNYTPPESKTRYCKGPNDRECIKPYPTFTPIFYVFVLAVVAVTGLAVYAAYKFMKKGEVE